MEYIFKDTFLLHSGLAQQLYQDFAKELPILDYHNHLSPQLIAENACFKNITEVWLNGDHYKWRAMRTMGVNEELITGNASDLDKFKAWATIVPQTLRNPLFHWTHMELKNPFKIEEYLNASNAESVFETTSSLLQDDAFTPQGLLSHFKVEMLGTTDDPTDDLSHHIRIKNSTFPTKVKPTFRPDNAFKIDEKESFRTYIQKLSSISGKAINDLESLISALKIRIDYFDEVGCVASDHGLSTLPSSPKLSFTEVNTELKTVLQGDDKNAEKIKNDFTFYVLKELCCYYSTKNWVQQFHLGALRNTNAQKHKTLGVDTGFDSIGDFKQASTLANFFSSLEERDALAKTVIYNLNPADNALFATMIGNFQGSDVKGKIQFGSGWWFLDQFNGITNQLNDLSNFGLISTFIGMLTDSRSFLSYSRHEYFRRILCNLFAEDVQKGHLPNDLNWIGEFITNICYTNAKNYFKQ